MLDFKQLKTFMVSADVESFSEAAKILYTTQSNVSKSVKALERSLGVKLFYREARGITLTAQGKNVYQYASRILEDMDELEHMSNIVEADWLSISTNPSSWFARRFTEYYNLHCEENLHCRVQTASVGEIMDRVRDCKDEIGFMYILGQDQASFQYQLERHHLEFVKLSVAKPMLYLGKGNKYCDQEKLSQENLDSFRYVQLYHDNFVENDSWQLDGPDHLTINQMDVAVVTNSDYIMEQLLQESKLANVSCEYLVNKEDSSDKHGIPVTRDEAEAVYGYVKRKGEKLSKRGTCFVGFITRKLEEN